MELGLNKQENTKTSEFMNFSIREYVAEIRKKDWKKCWPFGSLGDPEKYDVFASYQSSVESSNSFNKETFNGKENRSQTTDMIESLEINDNMCKRIDNGYLNSIYKSQNRPEISEDESEDNEESGRKTPKRKHQRVRLLSDILRNLDNVNTKNATETEDELDDVTMDALFREEKGVEDTTMSTKKMMTNRDEEPRFEYEEKSKCGSEESHGNDSDVGVVSGSRKTRINDMDFQTMAKRKKVRPLVENGASNKDNAIEMEKECLFLLPRRRKGNPRSEPTETGNEDSEMEAVMLLATHFNEKDSSSAEDGLKKAQTAQSNMEIGQPEAIERISSSSVNQISESGLDQGFARVTSCACVQKKIRANLILPGYRSMATFYSRTSAKSETLDPKVYGAKVVDHLSARVFQNRGTLVCSINRNPADFSIPNAENVFMRGG